MEPQAKPLNGLSKRDYWEKHFSEWEESGLAQSEYRALHGLSKHVFAYWKRKMKPEKEPATLVPVSIQPADLVPVSIRPDSSQSQFHGHAASASGLSLHFEGGIRLDVEEHFNPDTLRRVMSVIGRA